VGRHHSLAVRNGIRSGLLLLRRAGRPGPLARRRAATTPQRLVSRLYQQTLLAACRRRGGGPKLQYLVKVDATYAEGGAANSADMGQIFMKGGFRFGPPKVRLWRVTFRASEHNPVGPWFERSGRRLEAIQRRCLKAMRPALMAGRAVRGQRSALPVRRSARPLQTDGGLK